MSSRPSNTSRLDQYLQQSFPGKENASMKTMLKKRAVASRVMTTFGMKSSLTVRQIELVKLGDGTES